MTIQNGAAVQRLLFDVDWAIQHGLGPRDLVPMLNKLISLAEPGSDAALFGKRQLAETTIQEQPFRAAVLLREVLGHGDDDRAWALLGLAHTLLGNYRCAARSYARALALTPDNPWYAHNLGHVLDVALRRPAEALRHLKLSYRQLNRDPEVASSYAHALLGAGRRAESARVLQRALGDSDRVHAVLTGWLQRLPTDSRADEPATPSARARPRRRLRRVKLIAL
jgi:Flp pilus assembly protein TadD